MSPLYRKIALAARSRSSMLLYMVAFLDRVNISFAALTMNRDLGISDSLYGFAAGIFFLGYCLFEVPANMMLARLGARRWIALLLIVWGATSVGTAFVANRAPVRVCPVSSRYRRVRLLSRSHLLPHAMAAASNACADHGPLHACRASVQLHWIANLRAHPAAGSGRRAQGLAVAISS